MSASIELLTQGTGNIQWRSRNVTVQQFCELESRPSGCTLAFIGVDDSSHNISGDDKRSINKAFDIPSSFWGPLLQEASGFFSTFEEYSGSGEILVHNTVYRFSIKEPREAANKPYVWSKLGVFAQWRPSSGLVVLCFDLPSQLQEMIKKGLSGQASQLSLSQPFAIHSVSLECIVILFDKAVWAWRDQVRHTEENRASSANPEPDYMGMHEIARHVIHSSEMSDTAITVLNEMLDEQSIFSSENELPKQALSETKQTSKAFRHHISTLKFIHKRSRALEKRLNNEINSAFNVVAHSNSHTSVRIAEATQVDSAAMKAISFLGFAFLPATFISAIFSTQFFDFSPATETGPQQFVVSDKFWIYWATAIPVTIAALLSWLFWQRRYRNPSRDDWFPKPPASQQGYKEGMEMV